MFHETKQSPYAKMYLVTPLVYEKLKSCLNKIDKDDLDILNKEQQPRQTNRFDRIIQKMSFNEIKPNGPEKKDKDEEKEEKVEEKKETSQEQYEPVNVVEQETQPQPMNVYNEEIRQPMNVFEDEEDDDWDYSDLRNNVEGPPTNQYVTYEPDTSGEFQYDDIPMITDEPLFPIERRDMETQVDLPPRNFDAQRNTLKMCDPSGMLPLSKCGKKTVAKRYSGTVDLIKKHKIVPRKKQILAMNPPKKIVKFNKKLQQSPKIHSSVAPYRGSQVTIEEVEDEPPKSISVQRLKPLTYIDEPTPSTSRQAIENMYRQDTTNYPLGKKGPKVHQCEFCQKWFSRKYALDRHKKSFHYAKQITLVKRKAITYSPDTRQPKALVYKPQQEKTVVLNQQGQVNTPLKAITYKKSTDNVAVNPNVGLIHQQYVPLPDDDVNMNLRDEFVTETDEEDAPLTQRFGKKRKQNRKQDSPKQIKFHPTELRDEFVTETDLEDAPLTQRFGKKTKRKREKQLQRPAKMQTIQEEGEFDSWAI